jgi:hypothetical protein
MVVANKNPKHASIKKHILPTKIHFRPKISLKKPNGMIVEPIRTPMKKHAPMNPILDLDSHRISALFYQLSI